MSEFEAGWQAAVEAVDEPGYGTAALRLRHLARKRAESARTAPRSDERVRDDQPPAPDSGEAASEGAL